MLHRVTGGGAFESPDTPLPPLSRTPNGAFEYTPLSLLGPEETARPRVDYMARCRVGQGTTQWPAGQEVPVLVTVRAVPGVVEHQAGVEVRNWTGTTVAKLTAPLLWDGNDGTARGEVRLDPLPRGFYRIDASLPGGHATDAAHFTAVAVMGARDAKVADLFDTLAPLPKHPFLQGVDVNFEDAPGWLFGLQDLGVNFLQFHISDAALDDGTLDNIIALCRVLEVRFALNNEQANWTPSGLTAGGRNRFRSKGECHRWDLEPEALRKAAATGLFEGVVYDEGEHMRISRNAYSQLPDQANRMPYLVETTGMTLYEAHDAFYEAARAVQEYNAANGSRAQVESVFPVLWHPMARAGWRLGPKLLKEDVHPVVMAKALGAALQYSEDLWLSPDLWYMGDFPGHDTREYTAALRLAYWLGVDKVYTEHMVVLVRARGGQVDITPHGKALRAHIREWLPGRQRGYTWRDYRPEAAIVAFPTSDWGQGSCGYWDMLYGALDGHPTAESGQWMRAFSALTRGGTSPDAVNYNSSALPRPWPFAIPSPAVAVFDHLATADVLKDIPVLLLCDGPLSETTRAAVRHCVQRGTTCFTTPAHAPEGTAQQTLPLIVPDGQGCWVVVTDYTPAALGDTMTRLPEPGTTMRLRFGDRMIDVPVPEEIAVPS